MNQIYYGPRRVPTDIEGLKQCVGPGWGGIIEDLVAGLFELGWDGKVDQVKEKYGGLRFYATVPEEAEELISQAEEESEHTCEFCGEPGAISGGSWLKCRCDECVGLT